MFSGPSCYHLFPSTQNICCYNVAHSLRAHSPLCPSRLVVTSTGVPPFWVTPSRQPHPRAWTSGLSASDSTRRHPSPTMLRSQLCAWSPGDSHGAKWILVKDRAIRNMCPEAKDRRFEKRNTCQFPKIKSPELANNIYGAAKCQKLKAFFSYNHITAGIKTLLRNG